MAKFASLAFFATIFNNFDFRRNLIISTEKTCKKKCYLNKILLDQYYVNDRLNK